MKREGKWVVLSHFWSVANVDVIQELEFRRVGSYLLYHTTRIREVTKNC